MEGKGLMSREPGTCDPYVKVSGGQGGCGWGWGWGKAMLWTESQGPASVGLGPFEETVTAAPFSQ